MSATISNSKNNSAVKIQKGMILIYRVFDIAEEIELTEVERILSQASGPERLRLARSPRQTMVMRNAPVTLNLGETQLEIMAESIRSETFAKVWDYGTVSIVFQLPIAAGTTWTELIQKASSIENQNDIDTIARKRSQELAKALGTSLKRPNEWEGLEDYVIYFLEKIEGIEKARDLLDRADIPALIMAEPAGDLSPSYCEGILNNVHQYKDNDLAVIDWNSAVVFEPSGQRDLPDVLEFAVTHLLEMRYYDDLIDRRLAVLYDSVESVRARTIAKTNFLKLSHEASTRYIEFSEFIERVDNSLKVVGDFYLATIFRGAIKRFRVFDWQESITRKMDILAQVSELLQGEVNVQRSFLLEIIILLLIAFETISAFMGVHH